MLKKICEEFNIKEIYQWVNKLIFLLIYLLDY